MRFWKRWGPMLALLGAWALFFGRFAVPTNRVMYIAGDFSYQFGLFRDVVYRALVTGRFPLWADCLWSGYPIHADPQTQLFYPPQWLTFGALRLMGWGNFPLEALTAEIAGHVLALSFFLFGFLRARGLRPWAAVLGALTFAYGGYLTGFAPLQTAILHTLTWLPLMLWAAGQWAEGGSLRALAALASVTALAFLAGHPQTFAYALLLTLAYFVFRARAARQAWRVVAGRGLTWGALWGALVAVQLLPSLNFILQSTRASVSFEQAGHGFQFADVLQFFLTGVVSHWHPLFVGLLPLGLAGYALLRRASAETRFWGGAALSALLLSSGARGGLFYLAYWLIPGYRLFRDQERIAFVVSLALAVLAGVGADALFRPQARSARRAGDAVWRRVLPWAALLGAGLLGGALYLSQSGLDMSDWKQLPERVGVAALGLGLGLLAWGARVRLAGLRRVAPALFAGAVIIELFAASRSLNVVPPYLNYPPNPLVEPIAADSGFFRVQDDLQLPAHAGCGYGFRATDGITPYQIATYAQFVQTTPEELRWHWLGVRYITSWRAQLYTPSGTLMTSETVAEGPIPDARGNIPVTHRLTAPPRRAWLAHSVAFADEFVAPAETDDPFASVTLHTALFALEAMRADPAESVTVTQDRAGDVHLSTRSASAGALVLSEAHFPGWQAWVDGRAAPVVRANGALMAVLLPSGTHDVVFQYRPPLLVWSGAASALGWLMVMALLAWPQKARA